MTDSAAICAAYLEIAESLEAKARTFRMKAAAIAGDGGRADAVADAAEIEGLQEARAMLRARARKIGLEIPVDGLLTEEEFQRLSGKSMTTIRRWRTEGKGPFKGPEGLRAQCLHSRIVYRFDDLAAKFVLTEWNDRW